MHDVFERVYDARWPIQQMRLVDDFRGDDDRSKAATNLGIQLPPGRR